MTWQNRIVRYSEEPPDQLLANPKNWRSHPGSQAEALRGVLEDVGVVQNVIANVRTGYLIDGHLRVMEALKAGQPTIPVTWVDLSPEEEALILSTLDPLSAMAGTDAAQLDALLREVSSDSPAVQQMLSKLAEEAGVVPEAGAGGDEFDATPEETGPTRTALGDLWVIGGVHRLLVGDCTDPANVARLMGGERADAVVTDSPYGMNVEGVMNDNPETLRRLFDAVLRCLPCDDAVVVNFQGARLFWMWLDAVRAAGHEVERALWLYKPNDGTYPWRGWLQTGQIVLLSSLGKPKWGEGEYKHDTYVVNFVGDELEKEHATPKPVEVVQHIVSWTSLADSVIYDPFLGSGTTLIAAHRTGRRCYGLELEPRYADVVLRRAEAEGLVPVKVE